LEREEDKDEGDIDYALDDYRIHDVIIPKKNPTQGGVGS
jgi:hypothetical protein